MGTFFTLQLYEKIGISRVNVSGRVERSVISVFKTHIPYDCTVLIYLTQHEDDKKTSCLESIPKRYHLSMEGF